jgi:hypothetical protein
MNWRQFIGQLVDKISPEVYLIAACPTRVMRSRWPRALTRSTQKPFCGLLERHAIDQAGQNLGLRPLLFQLARIGEDYLWLPLIIADRPCHTDALAESEVSGVPNFSRLWPAACSGLRGAAVTEEVQTPNAATAATGLNGLILSPTVWFGAGNPRQTRHRAGA